MGCFPIDVDVGHNYPNTRYVPTFDISGLPLPQQLRQKVRRCDTAASYADPSTAFEELPCIRDLGTPCCSSGRLTGDKPKHQAKMEQALAQPRRNIIRVVITKVFNHLPIVAFLYLTFTVASSIYHSWGDAGTLAFVISSYVNLVLLFWCFDRFEKLGPNSPAEKRKRLKVAIWALATALNLAFAWRVSGVMPLALAVAIWSVATFVTVAGLYGLVIYKDK